MGCEFHKEYYGLFDARIEAELAQISQLPSWGKVKSVVSAIVISQSLDQITHEEAIRLYQRIAGYYPQYEESLQKELKIPSLTSSPQP